MNTNRRHAFAALVAAGLLWGTTVPLSKLALEWLAPGWLTAVRFGLATAVLLPVAVGYGGSVVVQNAGIIRTSVTHAALLVGAVPVLVAVIAAVWHRTVARPVAWAGFAVSLGGVGLVTAGGGGGGASVRGDLLVLASLLLSAGFTVSQTRLLPGRDPVAVTAVQFLGAAYGQSRVPAEVAGAFLNLEPLVGAMAGIVFFANPVGPRQALGGAAILAGIGLSTLRRAGRGRSAEVRAEQGEVGGREPVAGGLGLMPVGVDERRGAGLVEPGPFLIGEGEGRRLEVVG